MTIIHVGLLFPSHRMEDVECTWFSRPGVNASLVVGLTANIPHADMYDGVRLKLRKKAYDGHRSIRRRYRGQVAPKFIPLTGIEILTEGTVWRDGALRRGHVWLDGDELRSEFSLSQDHDPVELTGAIWQGESRTPFAFGLQREADGLWLFDLMSREECSRDLSS